jgi:hypothetical protein
MATVWAWKGNWSGDVVLDRLSVPRIAPNLEAQGRVEGPPHALAASKDRCFQGSNLVGIGFAMTPDEAADLIARDERNRDVLDIFTSGEDLTRNPSMRGTRWVVNFHDWPLERAGKYRLPLARVRQLVKPSREGLKSRAYRELWWQYGSRGDDLYEHLRDLQYCIAITSVSKSVAPVRVPASGVFSHTVYVVATDDYGTFGWMSSQHHWWWAVTWASTLESRVRYTRTDCFETFPAPPPSRGVSRIGETLDHFRSTLMADNHQGLTQTYNRVHDPDERAADITRLREIHVALDYAVRDAYGWDDLDLGHDFHETKFGTRFTFAPTPRQEILDRLLELNHEQYAEEVRQGLHAKAKSTKRKPKAAPAGAMTLGFDDV